ncbi:MAG: hypothetical protein BWK73_47205, partial [Thiothrix lacustris]
TLLGNVLRLRYQGDVQRRDTLKALVKSTGSQESRHAFKVMQAYEEWFAGQPELALLHLLGLFDHPIAQDVLQVLWDAQIPHLTAGIDEDDWLEAIAGLREEHHLLSQHDGGGDLDCHPLIREYFGKQLQTQHPDAWQQAHATAVRLLQSPAGEGVTRYVGRNAAAVQCGGAWMCGGVASAGIGGGLLASCPTPKRIFCPRKTRGVQR